MAAFTTAVQSTCCLLTCGLTPRPLFHGARHQCTNVLLAALQAFPHPPPCHPSPQVYRYDLDRPGWSPDWLAPEVLDQLRTDHEARQVLEAEVQVRWGGAGGHCRVTRRFVARSGQGLWLAGVWVAVCRRGSITGHLHLPPHCLTCHTL